MSGPSAPSGKIQTGGFDNSQGIYFYENLFKLAESQFAAKPFIIAPVLDNDGYPNNAPSNTLTTAINGGILTPAAWGTLPLVVSWSGQGGIAISCPGGFSNFVATGTGITNQNSGTLLQILGTNVRITFNFTTAPPAYPTALNWGFPPGTYTSMSHLIFCRQANETGVLANNNMLNPDFVTVQTALRSKIIRSMDSSGANNATSTLFAQRAPNTAVSFQNLRFIPGNWAGSVGGTNTYTLSAPPGWPGLIDGACVHFYVPAAQVNTLSGTSVTLNVAGTGAFQITTGGPVNFNAGDLVADDGTNTVLWTATYSAIYGYWTTTRGGLGTYVPLEQHIAIANAINEHLWYNISHRWPISDATAIVSVVKTNLNSQLNFYVECANEVWNTQFTQTSFVGNIMVTLGSNITGDGGLTNSYDGYALIVRRMMGALTTAWGGTSPRLKRVMAVATSFDTVLATANRLQGKNLATVAQGGNIPNSGAGNALWTSYFGAPNYTTVGNQPIDFCDVIATAPYGNGAYLPAFNDDWSRPPYSTNVAKLSLGGQPGYTTGVLGAADDWASGVPAQQANALAFVDWDLRQGVFNSVAGTATLLAFTGASNTAGINYGWEAVAASYDARRTGASLPPITVDQYEGSIAPSGPTIGTCTAIGISTAYGGVGGKVDNLITAYKTNVLFSQLVTDAYNQFFGVAAGKPNFGLMPHSSTYTWFQVTGPSTWGMLTGDLYTAPSSLGGLFSGTPYKSWDALVAIDHL